MPTPAGAGPRRAEGLEISVLDDGLVVYQPSHDRVHYLNPTAGLVLELCNGESDVAALAGLVADAYGLGAPPLAEVAGCVQELQAQALVL